MPNVFAADDEFDEEHAAEFADVPGDSGHEDEENDGEVTDEQIARVVEQEPTIDPSLDALDLECEQRFEVAMYYRTLLKGRLFNEDTKASRIVEQEARAFFRDRLEMLLGIKTKTAMVQAAASPFTAEQISVLQAVADKLMKKPSLADTKPAQPTLRRASAPVPQQAQMRSPAKPPSTPQKKPAQVKITQTPKRENGVVEDTGKVIEKGHKKYRIAKNELGTEFKQDITGQQIPTNRIPMPASGPGGALESVMQMQAANQVSKLNIEVGGHKVGTQDLVNHVSQGE